MAKWWVPSFHTLHSRQLWPDSAGHLVLPRALQCPSGWLAWWSFVPAATGLFRCPWAVTLIGRSYLWAVGHTYGSNSCFPNHVLCASASEQDTGVAALDEQRCRGAGCPSTGTGNCRCRSEHGLILCITRLGQLCWRQEGNLGYAWLAQAFGLAIEGELCGAGGGAHVALHLIDQVQRSALWQTRDGA